MTAPPASPIDRRPMRWVAAVGMASSAIALAAVAMVRVRTGWDGRVPGARWGASETAYWTAAALSAVSLGVTAAWLVPRLPRRHPIPMLMWATSVAFSGWIVSLYSPGTAAGWLETFLPIAFRATAAVVLLSWPHGRLEPRWAHATRRALIAWCLGLIVAAFLGHPPGEAPWNDPGRLPPTVGSSGLYGVRAVVSAAALLVVAPSALVVAVTRRRRRLPVAVRPLLAPVTGAAGFLLAADLWLFMSAVVARPIEEVIDGSAGLVTTARAVVDYGRFAPMAALLVVAARRRAPARAAQPDEDQVVVLAPRGLDAEIDAQLGALVGEPTALLLRRPDGVWIDHTGVVTSPPSEDLIVVELADEQDQTVAVVTRSTPGPDLSPTVIEAVGARVAATLAVDRRRAEAAARLAELRTLQRAVLDRQDDERRRLERALHDGAQQQLVALSIDLALAARTDLSPGERTGLASRMDEVGREVEQLLGHRRPPALDAGLAAALRVLAATSATPTSVWSDGDIDPDDRRIAALWFAACEAVTNANKHAGAEVIAIRLAATGVIVQLEVSDDGVGGVAAVPRALAERVSELGADLHFESPPGRGTTIRLTVGAHSTPNEFELDPSLDPGDPS